MKLTVISTILFLTLASAMAASPQTDYLPIVIAQATQVQAKTKIDRVIGVCRLVNSLDAVSKRDPLSPIYGITPAQDVSAYYSSSGYRKWLDYTKNVIVTIQKSTEHGVVKEDGGQDFRYTPTTEYIGADSAVFMVEIDSLNVKVIYNFMVINGGAIGATEDRDKKNCPKGMYWRVSFKPNSTGSVLWS